MRPIDGDWLLKRIPPEEVVSRATIAVAPTIEPERNEELLTAIRKEAYDAGYNDGTVDVVARFPALMLGQKKSKWIQISPAKIYECYECGQYVMTNNIDRYKFCHGCGCKMEGVTE